MNLQNLDTQWLIMMLLNAWNKNWIQIQKSLETKLCCMVVNLIRASGNHALICLQKDTRWRWLRMH